MKTPLLDNIKIKPAPVELAEDLTVWIRPLTTMEKDLCQAYARRASRALRKKLEDPESIERELLVQEEIEEYERTNLEALWISTRLFSKAADIRRQSLEDRDKFYVEEPDGPEVTSEQMERYEDEVEDAEEQRIKTVKSSVEAARENLEAEAKEIPIEDLRAEAVPALISNITAAEWTVEFNAQMVFRATYLDETCKRAAFANAEDTKTIRPAVMNKLVEHHFGLMVEPESLKN